MKNALKHLLALLVLLPLLGPAVPHQAAADPGAPQDVGVYEEDFTTYAYKDYTDNSEWDIWTHTLRLARRDAVPQSVPAIAVDGSHNTLVVWSTGDIYADLLWELDASGTRDIYAQRFDTNGNQLWAADVRVNSDSGIVDQEYPAVAVDISSNALLVWQDDRNGNRDVYAQKLDASGNKLWPADVRVNSDAGTTHQVYPVVTVDGSGNAFVVWEDERNGNNDVYAQKLDASGNKLWPADVRVDSDAGTAQQVHPVVTVDSSGNAFIVWKDFRNSTEDIYAQKLGASGNKLWTADVHVNSETGRGGEQWGFPAVASEGGGNAIIVWLGDSNDVYAQKLDASGNRLWTTDARVNALEGTAGQAFPSVATDTSGNAIVVWDDKRYSTWNIYAQKLATDGNRLWAEDVRVSTDGEIALQVCPAVVVDESGNAVIAWKDRRDGTIDIYTQKLDASGNQAWAVDVRANTGGGTVVQAYPDMAVDGSGHSIIVWEDYRNGNADIYAQKLDASGNRLWAEDVRVNSDDGATDQKYPAAVMSSSGNAVVVWYDELDYYRNIRAQKLDPDGNRLWTTDVYVNASPGNAWFPTVAIDSGNNAIVVWEDYRNSHRDIYAQRMDASGNRLWSADVRVNSDSGTTDQMYAAVAVDGSGNAFIVWQDDRNGLDDTDIYAQKLDTSGGRVWTSDVRVNSDAEKRYQRYPAVTTGGGSEAIVVWYDYRVSSDGLWAQKLSADGNRAWVADVRINSADWVNLSWSSESIPDVVIDGTGNILAVWNDLRNDNVDIYAQKLDASANRLWAADVRVNSDSTAAEQKAPAMAVDGSGNVVVVWKDQRNDNPDIYAQRLSAGGGKSWLADSQVVSPDLYYFYEGTVQSRKVNTTSTSIVQAELTTDYALNSGDVSFYLTNDGGAHWAKALPGVTHVFTATGSDLRWQAVLTSDPVWHRTPVVDSLRIEYSTGAAGGDKYEVDDTCTQAQPIQVNGTAQQHDLHQENDEDWAWFEGTAGSTYIVQTVSTGSRADTQIELYDQCGQPPAQFGDNAFGPDVTLTFQATVPGTYYVKVSQSDGSIYGTDTEYGLSVRTPTPIGMGAAIIVAGRDRLDDYRQPIINATANLAYQTFVGGGFSADDIMYLNADGGQPGVDDVPSKANIRDAIQTWARTRVGLGLPLWLYLVDHGDVDRFHNDVGEVVTAAELNLWLSNIEATSGVDQVNVIVDACNSGSFIDTYQSGAYGLDEISGHGRIVVGSTSSRWWAYAPPIVSGQPTPLMYFSDGFWHALDQGHDIWSAFLAGRATVEAAGQLCGDYDYVCQRPWLDDTGDAWFDTSDGQVAQGRGLAASFGSAIAPYIDWVEASDVAGGYATISAQVRDDGSVTRVWARVFAPSFQPPQTTDGSVPIVDVPEVELGSVGDDVYRLEYGRFTEAGMYQVVVYALDDEDNAATPKWVKVGGEALNIYLPLVLRGA
jgi:hypothetical protein